MRAIHTFALVTVWVGAVFVTPSQAAYSDPDWNAAPAWTATVAAGGFRAIPSGVCPFGFSDLAAYRGRARHDAQVRPARWHGVRSSASYPLRVYVWCG